MGRIYEYGLMPVFKKIPTGLCRTEARKGGGGYDLGGFCSGGDLLPLIIGAKMTVRCLRLNSPIQRRKVEFAIEQDNDGLCRNAAVGLAVPRTAKLLRAVGSVDHGDYVI